MLSAVVFGLVSQRGTDPATERRRLRESDDEDAIARLLDAIFWVSAEVLLFGLPTLAWTALYGDVAESFAMVVALSSLCLVGGVVRARRSKEKRERGWPPMSLRLVAFRLLYYNAALAGAVAVGTALVSESLVRVEWATDPFLGPAAVAGLLAGLAGLLLPTTASAVAGWSPSD
jgi:hypothetical protein